MGCQPCQERRARLEAAAGGGPLLPAKDWAFYAGWGLAAVLAAGLAWSLKRNGGTR